MRIFKTGTMMPARYKTMLMPARDKSMSLTLRISLFLIFCLLFSPIGAQTLDDEDNDLDDDEIVVTDEEGNESEFELLDVDATWYIYDEEKDENVEVPRKDVTSEMESALDEYLEELDIDEWSE